LTNLQSFYREFKGGNFFETRRIFTQSAQAHEPITNDHTVNLSQASAQEELSCVSLRLH